MPTSRDSNGRPVTAPAVACQLVANKAHFCASVRFGSRHPTEARQVQAVGEWRPVESSLSNPSGRKTTRRRVRRKQGPGCLGSLALRTRVEIGAPADRDLCGRTGLLPVWRRVSRYRIYRVALGLLGPGGLARLRQTRTGSKHHDRSAGGKENKKFSRVHGIPPTGTCPPDNLTTKSCKHFRQNQGRIKEISLCPQLSTDCCIAIRSQHHSKHVRRRPRRGQRASGAPRPRKWARRKPER